MLTSLFTEEKRRKNRSQLSEYSATALREKIRSFAVSENGPGLREIRIEELSLLKCLKVQSGYLREYIITEAS